MLVYEGRTKRFLLLVFFKYIYIYLPFVNMFNAYDARSGRHPIFTLSMVYIGMLHANYISGNYEKVFLNNSC